MVNSSMHEVLQHGTLAQLVEQRTFNPLVAGSNPARPTTPPWFIPVHTRYAVYSSYRSLQRGMSPPKMVLGSCPLLLGKLYLLRQLQPALLQRCNLLLYRFATATPFGVICDV